MDGSSNWTAGRTTEESEFRFPVKVRNLSVLQCPDRLWGPPSYWSGGIGGLSSHEADLLPASSAVVKK